MNFPGRAAAGGVDARGCAELQRSDVRVERVHTAISHHATAKIPPAPPGGRVIGTVVGPHRGRANPCIPVEPRGHGHRLLWGARTIANSTRHGPRGNTRGCTTHRPHAPRRAGPTRSTRMSAGCLLPSDPGFPSGL